MSEQDDIPEFATETLSGDLRDVMLTHIRSMETPWSKLSENDQTDKIYAIQNATADIVRRAVGMIAANGHEVIEVKIEKFTVKETIKMETIANVTSLNIERLAENRGRAAILTFVSAADFIGERSSATADPDQPGLPIDDTDDGNVGDLPETPEFPDEAAA